MKIKFSKIAALLLAGVVCLAPGCTDYQSDINDIYQKIDKLASKESVATLQQQVNGLEATLAQLQAEAATHATKTELQNAVNALQDADKALSDKIDGLSTELRGLISSLDGRLQSVEKELPVVKTNLENLTNNFNEYKAKVDPILTSLQAKDEQLDQAIKDAEARVNARVDQLDKDIKAEVTARDLADKALGQKIDDTKSDIYKYVDAADALIKKDILDLQAKDEALQAAIDDEAAARAERDSLLDLKDVELEAAIEAEAKLREAEDTVLVRAIRAEVAARQLADAALQAAINDEVEAREIAVEAEKKAREAADAALDARVDALKEALDDLDTDYKVFKAKVTADIAACNTKIAANEAAIKKMVDETIPAIQQHIDDVEALANQNKDDLEAFKTATNATIKVMQDAIDEIEVVNALVNARQSDSLKKAFEKFDDYVLKTTFETYQAAVQAKLDAKVDTAAYNAKMKALDAKMKALDASIAGLNLRLMAEEEYTNSLKTEIIPALEATDDALRASIDSLVEVVDAAKVRIDSIVNALDGINETLAEHKNRISSLESRATILEVRVRVIEGQVAELLARIQSIEFVPDYDDCKATINYIQVGNKFFDAESQITYKVYPAELADSLAMAINAMIEDPEAEDAAQIYFAVVPVQTRNEYKDGEALPGLQIVKAEPKADASAAYKGMITLTVKGQNVQDFYIPKMEPATAPYGWFGPMPTYESWKLAMANYQALNAASSANGVSPYSPVADNEDEAEAPSNEVVKHQDYSSALVIENNFGGNVITSEFNNWAQNPTVLTPKGFGHMEEGQFVSDLLDCKERAFNETDEVTMWKEGTELYLHDGVEYLTVAAAEEKYGVDLAVKYSYKREVYTGVSKENHNNIVAAADDANRTVFTKLADVPTALADELTYAKEQLSDDILKNKKAIGYYERVNYGAIIGSYLAVANVDLHITKVIVNVEPKATIYWTYSKDVAGDAAIYANADAEKNQYSREGVVIDPTNYTAEFTKKGLELTDLVGAAANLVDYTLVVNRKGAEKPDTLCKDITGIQSCVTTLNVEVGEVANVKNLNFDLKNFEFQDVESYVASAKYELDAHIVNVDATINIVDRDRTPLKYEFDQTTITYAKAMSKEFENVKDLHEIYNDLKAQYACADEKAGLDVSFVDWVNDNFNKDRADWNLSDIANTTERYSAKYTVNEKNDSTLAYSYNLKYDEPQLIGKDNISRPGVVALSTYTHSYYGQKVIYDWSVKVVAPKYDFRHNTYYVYGKYEKDNSVIASYEPYELKDQTSVETGEKVIPFYTKVEPYYESDKWNLTHFDVKKVNLPEAFKIVNENMDELSEGRIDTLGLVASFSFADGFVPQANNDKRSNDPNDAGFTYIGIDDNLLYYHGWDEDVPVYGELAIVTDGGEIESDWSGSDVSLPTVKFVFPTSFDAGFEAVYAAKLPEDDVKEGRYADYNVVKFNPLHDFEAGETLDLPVFNAEKYRIQLLKNLSLLDERRYDAEDPMCQTGGWIESKCEFGINLFEGGQWKVGNNVNGFAAKINAYDAYDLKKEYKPVFDDATLDPDIKNKFKIETVNKPVEGQTAATVEVPYLLFDYTQQLTLTQPIKLTVNVELIHPWIEKAMVAPIKVTVHKSAASGGQGN